MSEEEVKNLLRDILGALTSADGSTTKLVKDVRDALRGTSEPTVRDTIVQLQTTIQREFDELKAVLRNDGGAAHGGTVRPGDSAELEQIRSAIINLTAQSDDLLSRIERSVTSLLESGGARGERSGGGFRDYFERERQLTLTRIIDDLSRREISSNDALAQFRKLIGGQFTTTLNDLQFAAGRAALSLTNLSTQFHSLHSALKSEFHAVMDQGVYGSNVLGPLEYMLEGPKRALQGMLLETDSWKSTVRTVQQTIQEGLQSPLSMLGRDAVELSRDFHAARQGMREHEGFDSRGWMSTEMTNKALYDMAEIMRRFGVQQTVNSIENQHATADELKFLSQIAVMTGKTVEQLEPIAAAAMRDQARMVAMGRLNSQEAAERGQTMFGVSQRSPETQATLTAMQEMLGYGRTRNQILTNGETPDYIKSLFAARSEEMSRFLAISEHMNQALQQGETQGMRTETIIKELGDVRNIPSLQRFQAAGGLNGNPAEQTAMAGGSVQGRNFLAQLLQGAFAAQGTASPDQALRDRQGSNPNNVAIGYFQDIWKNQIAPLFMGLPGALLANKTALWANTGAIIALGRGGGFGGLGGMLGGFASGALKFGTGIAAAGGLAYEGVGAYNDIQGGRTGSALGTVAGMGTGAVIGGALGTLTDWFTGPFGTLVGASVGGAVGQYLGGLFDSKKTATIDTSIPMSSPAQQAPAVPAPQNMAGPSPADQIYSAQNATYQDASLGLMGQLVQVNTTGNSILGQMFGALSRLAGAKTGDPTGAGGIPAGATGAVTPPPIGKPDASYPYVSA